MKKQVGLILLFLYSSNDGIAQYSPYVQQLPIGAMANVGAYKQRKYNDRAQWIQDEVNRMFEVLNAVFNKNTLPENIHVAATQKIYWSKFTNYIRSIASVDYSDDSEFYQIKNSIKSYENWFYESYNSLIRSQ